MDYINTAKQLKQAAISELKSKLPEGCKDEATQIIEMKLCIFLEDLSFFIEDDLIVTDWLKEYWESMQPDGATY